MHTHVQSFNAVLTHTTLGMSRRYIASHGNMADAILRPRTLVNSRGRTLLETNYVIPSSAVIRRAVQTCIIATCVLQSIQNCM